MKMVCAECGSENVRRDAWASWNETEQDWELSHTFDYAHCDDCDGSTSIEAMEPPQTVFRDNNDETYSEFDSKSGAIRVDDTLYRIHLFLNLEDVEMIVNNIRKANPDFLKG